MELLDRLKEYINSYTNSVMILYLKLKTESDLWLLIIKNSEKLSKDGMYSYRDCDEHMFPTPNKKGQKFW